MGKDKTKDGDAATSSETNRDHSWDQEARDTTLAKTIAEAVARETQTIAEVFAREMAKAHAQYQATVKENHASTLPSTLKVTSGLNGFRIMDPLTGQWTKLSTRDGNCGHIRLDLPLMPWGRLREHQNLLFSPLDQWRRDLKDRRMEKQQNPHQPVRL